ncbi:trehalose-6-phosphate synthase [Salmonella enterica subsp. arizonae]|uniref:Trehalose-6-phosphate synthase n=1 Tax=Salmonella enterica subsp. arizonae TaxID=59203 RepID=A0A447R2X8_SALER|nr:trehalose-6-phosphate synthase [Salmonella enterica subsp. arizonae]
MASRHIAWGKDFQTEVYPIGIEPDEIALQAAGPLPPKLAQLKAELKNVKIFFPLSDWIIRKGCRNAFWRMKRYWKTIRSTGEKFVTPKSRLHHAAKYRHIRIFATSLRRKQAVLMGNMDNWAGRRSII